MKVSALICELNPLHNGHKYIMNKAKKDGYPLVAVMSGNFVQRGEPAVFDKWIRAEAALAEGADLVIELPDIYSCSSAEYFAKGSIGILNASGLECDLFFGVEEDNIDALNEAVKRRTSSEYILDVKSKMKDGNSYASSSDAVLKPNNILALEYITAVKELSADRILPCSVPRIGDESHIETASEIRKRLGNIDELSEYIPSSTLEIIKKAVKDGLGPADAKNVENYIIAALRQITSEELETHAFVSEGLENKMIAEAYRHNDFDDFVSACTSKRYTASRIRRAAYSLITGITNDELQQYKNLPPYIRILGVKESGVEVLSFISKNASVPVIINASDREKLTSTAKVLFEKEVKATALYEMTHSSIEGRRADIELTHPLVKV